MTDKGNFEHLSQKKVYKERSQIKPTHVRGAAIYCLLSIYYLILDNLQRSSIKNVTMILKNYGILASAYLH